MKTIKKISLATLVLTVIAVLAFNIKPCRSKAHEVKACVHENTGENYSAMISDYIF